MDEGKASVERVRDFPGYLRRVLEPYDGRPLNLMVAGGSLLRILDTPGYKSLRTDKWNLFYSDERYDQNLLNYTGSLPFIERTQVNSFPMHTVHGDEEATNYEKVLADAGHMDICVLGIGEDGHICSIWPGSVALTTKRWVVPVEANSELSPGRLTTTIEFINSRVKRLIFLVPLKEGALKKVERPHNEIAMAIKIPYTIVLYGGGKALW